MRYQNIDKVPLFVFGGEEYGIDILKVQEIRVEGGRAVGVTGQMFHPDTREAGGKVTVSAPRVILSCGGIGTPRLLHHSGIASRLGPAIAGRRE